MQRFRAQLSPEPGMLHLFFKSLANIETTAGHRTQRAPLLHHHMKIPGVPKNERQRVQALHDMQVLANCSDESLDTLVEISRALFDVPIAYISFVDSERQFLKSKVGIEARETERSIALCAHAILESRPMVVEDTLKDERFFDNPLVTSGPKIRFYAGAQIRTMDGYCVGTLCIADTKPRILPAESIAHLELLARLVTRLTDSERQMTLALSGGYTHCIPNEIGPQKSASA